MRKMLVVLCAMLLMVGLLVACGGKENNNASNQNEVTYKDGVYKAEAAEFDANSGWKENVELTIENGRIVDVTWNGTHKDGGTDKITRSESGEYGMVAFGNAQAEWHEQAIEAEQFLIEKQDPKALALKEDGKTDAISGVSINVGGLVKLVEEALAQAK